MDSQTIKVLAIPGSLRKDSYNKALLEEASRLAPGGVDIEVYRDGQSIPPYNQDMDGDLSPAPVLDYAPGYARPTRSSWRHPSTTAALPVSSRT